MDLLFNKQFINSIAVNIKYLFHGYLRSIEILFKSEHNSRYYHLTYAVFNIILLYYFKNFQFITQHKITDVEFMNNTTVKMKNQTWYSTYVFGQTIIRSNLFSIFWMGKFCRNRVLIVQTPKTFYRNNLWINTPRINGCRILKYLSDNMTITGKQYITPYIDDFEDKLFHYSISNCGGTWTSLLDFVTKAHKLIERNKLMISEWQKAVYIIFKQMLHFIDMLHNEMNICHLNISLDNVLINDPMISLHPQADSIKFISEIKIKFYDFSNARQFPLYSNHSYQFQSVQSILSHCSHKEYVSPEIYNQQTYFNASSSDVWSLGICLFAISVGSFPFSKPSRTDPGYQYLVNGSIYQLLHKWHKTNYIDNFIGNVLSRIFKYRINITELNELFNQGLTELLTRLIESH